MKNLLALTLSFGLLVCGLAYAAESKDGKTAQQEKMTACNAQAGDKKGDERKAFMKSCLSGKSPRGAKPKRTPAESKAKSKGMPKEEARKPPSESLKSELLNTAASPPVHPGPSDNA